jgi:hypothetical protein
VLVLVAEVALGLAELAAGGDLAELLAVAVVTAPSSPSGSRWR